MNKTTALQLTMTGAILAMATVGLCAERCVLRIRPAAQLTRTVVCLGDVAEIVQAGAAGRERLATLVIASSHDETMPDRVGEFEISRALSAAGINPVEVDLFGASVCRLDVPPPVEASVVAEPAEPVEPVAAPDRTVADQLTDYVASATGIERGRLVIGLECRAAGFLEQAADDRRFSIKPLSPVSLGAMRFDVIDSEATGPAARIRVSGDLRCVQEAVVATRPLKPGQTIGPDDVRLVAQTLTDLDRRGLARLDEAVGQELCRALNTNEPVLPWMVKKLAVVRRNDAVDIVNEFRGIRVTLLGKAQSDGALDDIIAVQVRNSANTLRCRILASGRVEVVKGELAGPVADLANGKGVR